jgi:hypothetical protein
MAENIDEIIPPSSTELVSLNTRVPRFVDNFINQSVGMIQTASHYHKVSKQMAIQILIEKGYQQLKSEFESMDNPTSEANEKVVSISPVPKPQNYTFNINSYYEMSNKSTFEPRKPEIVEEKTGIKKTIREKLGLK